MRGMDSRTARRTAEKAARDLITSRAALVGELGVTQAERTRLAQEVLAATEHGRQLVAAAQAEAARLVAAAQDLVHDGEQRYADAYTAATTAGWTTGDLTALGFQPSPSTNPRRRRTTGDAVQRPAGALPAQPAVPEQHAAHDQQPAAAPTP